MSLETQTKVSRPAKDDAHDRLRGTDDVCFPTACRGLGPALS